MAQGEKYQWCRKRVKSLIFSAPICLHDNDFSIEHMFNKALKFFKNLKHLRFAPKEIYPSKFAKVVYETDIVFFLLPKESIVRPQTSEKIRSKGALE
jgi:hypothetical protein